MSERRRGDARTEERQRQRKASPQAPESSEPASTMSERRRGDAWTEERQRQLKASPQAPESSEPASTMSERRRGDAWTEERQRQGDDLWAWVALAALVEPGNRELGMLVRRIGVRHAIELICSGGVSSTLAGTAGVRLGGTATPAGVRALGERLIERSDRLGVRIVFPGSPDWPHRVNDLNRISRDTGAPVDRDTDAPLCLWVRGAHSVAEMLDRSVAIVGARAATDYGVHVTGDLAHGMAERDWTIVSGGALGVDAAAHRAALAAGGRTVAVLACGIDRPYPLANTGLLERIGDEGLLISEWPPGAPPYRVRFLIRNRVIAAASSATLMVEAAHRSGARQTLHRATHLGRPALVVPGPVTSAMSVGCHEELRREGIRLVASVAHVLEEVGRIGQDLAPVHRGQWRPHDDLDPISAQVLEAVLPRKLRTAEEIAAAAGVSPRDARRTLPGLVATGHVAMLDDGYRLARHT
jgi:DNA processing protein